MNLSSTSMTKPDLAAMSDKKLRAYILLHRDDQEAFQIYCDRLYARPGIKVTSWEQFEQLIQNKIGINPQTQADSQNELGGLCCPLHNLTKLIWLQQSILVL
jgi:hypothetical protein